MKMTWDEMEGHEMGWNEMGWNGRTNELMNKAMN